MTTPFARAPAGGGLAMGQEAGGIVEITLGAAVVEGIDELAPVQVGLADLEAVAVVAVEHRVLNAAYQEQGLDLSPPFCNQQA